MVIIKNKIESLWKVSIFFLLMISIFVISGCIENKPTAIAEINTPIPTPPPKQYINMDYETFVKPLDSMDKLTDLQKQNFYNSLNSFNGKYVQWRLHVQDVTEDHIAFSRLGGDDASVILYVAEDQKTKLASLNKQDIITIEGMINDETIDLIKKYYKYRQRITLFDGKIISKG